MKTQHKFFFSNSCSMGKIKNQSVDLIVTSPAYPMIEMWDTLYGEQNSEINKALAKKDGDKAYTLMHQELNKVWEECHRVLKDGGFACINIGDSTRTIGGRFQLYSNHSYIIQQFKKLGFHTLPIILWHKKANTPNKFMGSGMLPSGAYVTLEHEYILIFRKGHKRSFKTEKDIQLRRKSAIFWEERNKWFSDIWFDVPGVSQELRQKNLRKRSAAFPLELAYRLICMYSVQSDTVLDPFAGAGTTALAGLATGRNSVSFEINKAFRTYVMDRLTKSKNFLNNKTTQRLLNHIRYVEEYKLKKPGTMKYQNSYYDFPVMTSQETSLQFPIIQSIDLMSNNLISAEYASMNKNQILSPTAIKNYKSKLNKAHKMAVKIDKPMQNKAPQNYEQIMIEL